MEWDGGEASAGLTKDILALANCRDGGVIVVGKQESQPGKFVLAGLSELQAASFETTKVATWVYNHCSPRRRYRATSQLYPITPVLLCCTVSTPAYNISCGRSPRRFW
jgi:hypothetical protein